MIKFKNHKQFAEAIMQAMESGDEAKIREAWENFHQALSEQIEADFEDIRNSNDAAILAQRGYRQLTNKETKWYNKVIDALRRTPAITGPRWSISLQAGWHRETFAPTNGTEA